MLGNIFNKSEDDNIKKEMEKKREKVIRQSASLRKLINSEDSGWREYVSLVQDYIASCKRRKAVTALDTADDKTLAQLRLIDHEIFILSWALKIPEQIFDQENKIDELNKKESVQ